MTSKWKTIVGIGAFVLLLAGAYAGYQALSAQISPGNSIVVTEEKGEVSSAAHEKQSPDKKTKAPDFTMTDADGNTVRLSDLTGKPIVLNFWASWCPPCKREMPEFDKVYGEVKDEVQFVMVDLTDGQRETAEKGAQYVAEQGFSFPVYFDTGQEGAIAYGVMSIPTTLFIDKDGYVVTGAQGAIDEQTLRQGISLIE